MNTSELQEIKNHYRIVGNCDALNRALDIALQVAPTDLSVLIVGESGVGKRYCPELYTTGHHVAVQNTSQ